jgi:hypothetical protein
MTVRKPLFLFAQDRAAAAATAIVQTVFNSSMVRDLQAQIAAIVRDEIIAAVHQALADIPSIDP